MKLSYSAISTYQNCPLKYRSRYVEGLPSLPGPALSFGQSVHEALRWFYSVPTPDPCSLDELMEYIERCWVSEGYAFAEEETRYFLQAKSVLQLFYRNNAEDFRLPAALEYKFRIDVGFCELSGVIDRLDKNPDGGFEIIDYKTNRRLPPARKLKEDLQLPIYHIACEDIWNVSPDRVTFYYLLMNHRHSIQVTPSLRRKALDEIERVVEAISSRRFEPRVNNLCPWCDYAESCPAFHGERKVSGGSLPELEIGQAVDELVDTQNQVSFKLSRMEALKDMVASYMANKGIERLEGSRGTASIDVDGSLCWEEKPDARPEAT